MKTTKKMPFSNGTDFLHWTERNCAKCDRYENESTERKNAKCKYIFDIEYATGSGTVPVETLDYFGFAKYFQLADCPNLHCGRIKSFSDYEKAVAIAEKNKKTELPF